MDLNIENQVPIKCKILYQCKLFIPKDIQRSLDWKAGDILSLYATKQGIFFTKED